jgi:transcriptional regulator with XRE-family HTH domain
MGEPRKTGFKVAFGKRLKKWRRGLGIKQQVATERLNRVITRYNANLPEDEHVEHYQWTSWSSWEQGVNSPSPETIMLISESLGAPAGLLLGLPDPAELSENERFLVERFRAIKTTAGRRMVLELAAGHAAMNEEPAQHDCDCEPEPEEND